MTRFKYVAVALVASCVFVGGCANTIRGAGKDAANTVNAVEGAGNNVAQAAK